MKLCISKFTDHTIVAQKLNGKEGLDSNPAANYLLNRIFYDQIINLVKSFKTKKRKEKCHKSQIH